MVLIQCNLHGVKRQPNCTYQCSIFRKGWLLKESINLAYFIQLKEIQINASPYVNGVWSMDGT